jgi:holo-[acyl-carrier protein] synthase
MIVGIGVDVCEIARLEEALDRNPGLAERLFTDEERVLPNGQPRPVRSLAGRFAAKEAVAKALGAPSGLGWHQAVILPGKPLDEASETAQIEAGVHEPADLGWPGEMSQVRRNAGDGAPLLHLEGAAKALADELGVQHIHLSISHDGGVAVAMVVCEGR